MTNILPQDVKRRAVRSVRTKFVLVTAAVACATAFIALFSLLPAYIRVAIPRATLEATSASLLDAEAQATADRDAAGRTRAILAQLAPVVAQRPSIADTVASVIEARPQGVVVQRVSYRPGESASITLTGTAPDRDVIGEYRTLLAQDERFTSVTIPVAALVGVLAGSFTITLTGTF